MINVALLRIIYNIEFFFHGIPAKFLDLNTSKCEVIIESI